MHVNHGLHPQPARWVRALPAHLRAALGVPLRCAACGSRARAAPRWRRPRATARYAALAAELQGGEVLLTAHTQDDQLETVLLQLFRGAGSPGLAAMPAVAPLGPGPLARPLLGCRARSCAPGCARGGLTWVEDHSNAGRALRPQLPAPPGAAAVAPALAGSRAPRWRARARHAAQAQRLLDALAAADLERAVDGAALSVKALRSLPPDRRRNALRCWIAAPGCTPPDARRLAEIAGPLLDARADAHPRVAGGASVRAAQRHGASCCPARRGAVAGAPAAQLAWDWRQSRSCRCRAARARWSCAPIGTDRSTLTRCRRS